METLKLFTTPVSLIKLNEDLKKLNNFCLKFKKNDKGRNISNRGGYQSSEIDFLNIKELKTFNQKLIENVFKYSSYFNVKGTLSIGNMWININGYKDFNSTHVHPQSFISGSFYVNVPNNSGNIILYNTNNISNFLNVYNIDKFTEINSTAWTIPVEENLLILFPSWLPHEVEPNMSQEKRISIAFNINIK